MKKLEFAQKVASTLESFGTVGEVAAQVGLNPANISGDKLIFADLYNAEGMVVRAYLTPNLTADVRKRKFPTVEEVRSYLHDMQIIETTNEDGDVRIKISHPFAATNVGKVVKSEKKQVSLDEITW